MSVYARGYRKYDGGFRSMPAALGIFSEGARMALARKGIKRILIFVTLGVCVYAGILYFQFGVQEQISRRGGPTNVLPDLNLYIRGFHQMSVLFAALGSVLVGAGLIADDLRTRALSLYLVRPIRPVDYMLGKALIIPALLVPLALLPGLTLYLLVGSWQPPGETWTWLRDNVEIAQRILKFYVIGSLSLTGLMLLLSSRTPRRGVVIGLAAAVVFGGMFLRVVGRQVGGEIGQWLKATDLTSNMMHEMKLAATTRLERMLRWQAETDTIWMVTLALFAAGLFMAWRRARTVEVRE